MPETTLTWLGHSAFRFDTPGGKRVYIDPFLNGNPKCPESELEPERVDVIALTHGHGDHLGDTVELAKKHGCTVDRAGRARRLAAGQAGPRERPRPEQGRHGRGRRHQVHAHERASLELEQRPRVHGRAVRHRRRGREREEALLRRRHVRLRRHAAHPPALRARPRRSSRSATTTRWSRRRPRSRSSSSARSAACPATTARSRRSRARRPSCASSRPTSRSTMLEPGDSVTL